jgi:trigger factor
MNIQVVKIPKSKVEFKIVVSVEEFEKFKKQTIEGFGRELKIEGFRAGHIPEAIILKEVGEEKILAEAAELAVRENYLKAVNENKIVPISAPDVQILKLAKGNDFEFKVQVSVLPEITLPDYKKLASEFSRKEVSISETEIKDSLDWLQKSRAKLALKSGGAEKGDFVEIEFSSSQLENGKRHQDAFLLGHGHIFEGFEENLLGMTNGAEKKFQIKVPETYPDKALAGKKADFNVLIKSVQKVELPELTDDFAKGLGTFKGLEDLKKGIKEGLVLEKEKSETERMRTEILDKITSLSKCEVPEVLLETEKTSTLDDLKKQVLENLKISFEEYLAKIKKTEKELLESFSDKILKRIKTSLVLKEIANKEKVEVLEDEIKREVDDVLKNYPDVKTAKKQLDLEQLKDYAKEVIINEKAMKILEDCVKKQ